MNDEQACDVMPPRRKVELGVGRTGPAIGKNTLAAHCVRLAGQAYVGVCVKIKNAKETKP